MPTVVFTQNLRRHVNLERMDVGGDTVKEVLAQVLINGESITDRAHLCDPVPADAKVFVVQALSGG